MGVVKRRDMRRDSCATCSSNGTSLRACRRRWWNTSDERNLLIHVTSVVCKKMSITAVSVRVIVAKRYLLVIVDEKRFFVLPSIDWHICDLHFLILFRLQKIERKVCGHIHLSCPDVHLVDQCTLSSLTLLKKRVTALFEFEKSYDRTKFEPETSLSSFKLQFKTPIQNSN